jgi:NitT/TauT family transport system substrate-binding protein
MKFTRRRFGIAASVVLATGLTPALAQDKPKIRVGVLRLASSGNVFIAADRNYFKDAGLDVELKFFDAAQPIAVATASGDVDVGVTAFTAGLFNLAGKGAVSIIAGQSRDVPGFPLMAYLATSQPAGASLKSLKDIDGKSVGITQVGSSFHYSAGLIAEKYKFPLANVKFVVAIDVECRVCAEGRTCRSGDPACDCRAAVDRFRRRPAPWLGRR